MAILLVIDLVNPGLLKAADGIQIWYDHCVRGKRSAVGLAMILGDNATERTKIHLEFLLIRHGEQTGNVVTYDVPDGELTDKGKEQGRRLGERLKDAGLTHIISSPLLRALGTATFIADACDLPIDVWKPTYECRDLGLYVGPPLAALQEEFPRARFESDMEPDGWIYPGDEDEAKRLDRAKSVIERLYREFGKGDKVAFVAHGGFNRLLLEVLLGMYSSSEKALLAQENTCINHLTFGPERVVVHSINDIAHLADMPS